MRRAVCPGSFDPVTLGHLDIVGRASKLFDEVVVAVGVNPSKSRLFSADERIAMLERACADFANVRVASFTGLLTDFCRANDVNAIVKGLRAGQRLRLRAADGPDERLASPPSVETVFVPTAPEYSFLASSLVKEVAAVRRRRVRVRPGLRPRGARWRA